MMCIKQKQGYEGNSLLFRPICFPLNPILSRRMQNFLHHSVVLRLGFVSSIKGDFSGQKIVLLQRCAHDSGKDGFVRRNMLKTIMSLILNLGIGETEQIALIQKKITKKRKECRIFFNQQRYIAQLPVFVVWTLLPMSSRWASVQVKSPHYSSPETHRQRGRQPSSPSARW